MIHFTQENWKKIRETYRLWWAGELDRPAIKMPVANSFAPVGTAPKAALLEQHNCHDFSVAPEEIIEAYDYELSQYEFLGDSYPHVNFSVFGPGVLAAFCDGKLDNSSGRVWFFPQEELPIEQIHIKYNSENMWVKRIKAIYKAGQEKWGGNVLMSMPDLGGTLDVVATFVGSENLLLELYDSPQEVLRLCDEAQEAWFEAYNDLNSVLQQTNPGFSDWGGIYSEKPSYILQSDFSYMIGTPMFDEFVLPYLKDSCNRLDNTIYHLDGINELSHLEHILEIPNLNAVQWVYGDGQPSAKHWIEVYQKIQAAKKGNYMIGGFDDLATMYPQINKGIYMNAGADNREEAVALLTKYNVPV